MRRNKLYEHLVERSAQQREESCKGPGEARLGCSKDWALFLNKHIVRDSAHPSGHCYPQSKQNTFDVTRWPFCNCNLPPEIAIHIPFLSNFQ